MSDFRSYSVASALTTTLTITKPAGTVQGDVMVAVVASGSNDAGSGGTYEQPQTPSGWTALTEQDAGVNEWGARTFYKVAGASEPANYSFVLGAGAANTFAGGQIVTYFNVAAIDGNSLGLLAGNSLIARAPSVTTTIDSDRVVLLYASKDPAADPFSTPAGTTKRGEGSPNNVYALGAFDFVKTPAGSTGIIDSTGSAAGMTCGAQIALTTTGGVRPVRIWNGAAWVDHTAEIWDGAAWVTHQAVVWNGTAWVDH